MTRLLGSAMVAALLACCPSFASAGDVPSGPTVVERPESDVVLLRLRLDQATLADTLPTYENRGSVLVPLGEICRLLGLGISVELARGFASGFFIQERRRFALDLVARTVLVDGKAKRFDLTRIELHRDDIYVDATLLSEWLPLHLDVDLLASAITARPEEKLPLQLRLEREQKLTSLVGGVDRAVYPRFKLPYRLLDGPFIDQALRLSRVAAPGGGQRNALEYSTYATGDVLFMEGSAFVSGTQQGVADSRFSLGRKDPDGRLLGPLGAREVSVGDVFHPGMDLIAAPTSGPGLVISNFPLDLQSQFDRQSFRGDLPPGWEAELYRGAELLAFAQARPDGLYEFLDVPLLFGLNVFHVELYGPQGQHRSETRRFNVLDTLTPKGRLYYRLAGDDPGSRLLGTGLPGAEARSSVEVSAGLAKNLSLSMGVASLGLQDRQHTYGKAALRAYWGFLFANVDFVIDRGGGSAWQGTALSRLGAFGLQVQHAEFDRFVSELYPSGELLLSRTAIRLDAAIPETLLPTIPILFELRQDRFAGGQRVTSISGRVSAFRRGLAIANQMNWNYTSGFGPLAASTGSGQLLVSKFLQRFAVRGEIAYAVKPGAAITSVALTGEKRVGEGLLLSAGVNRINSSGDTRFLAGVSRTDGPIGYTVTAEYSSLKGLGASALLSLSVGRDGRGGGWFTQARPLAGSGAVSGRAFLDANGNGLMDTGEQAIAGAGFLVNGAGSLIRTSARGEALLPNLSPYQDFDLAVAPSTLEDPFWIPAVAGVRVSPRPGKVARVDFPVVVSGEISGTVYLRGIGKDQQASGVELELVDQHGVVRQKARSGYDGFYDIAAIVPGKYTLSVTAASVVRLRVSAPSLAVTIASSGTVLDGIDFVLPANVS
ncbi:MAG: hypothetical protein ABI609_17715 [Acidobacteriota bacterium]